MTVTRSGIAPLKAFAYRGPTNFPDAQLRTILLSMYGEGGSSLSADKSNLLRTTADGTDLDITSPGFTTITSCKLDLQNKAVNSFEGCRYFTNTTLFQVKSFPMTSIDLTQLPPNLTTLSLIYGELTQIDPSTYPNHAKLTTFNVAQNNMSVLLDIRSLTGLDPTSVLSLLVGAQKNDATLLVVMTAEQKVNWDNTWNRAGNVYAETFNKRTQAVVY